MMNYYLYETVIGRLYFQADDQWITRISFREDECVGIECETPLIRQAYLQLDEYFQGNRVSFDFQMHPRGTAFQQKVWEVLKTIPYGEVWSYKRVAEAVGNPRACRAVGMANNKNPLPVVVPCHRVIGTSGKLVGYAGGLEVKERLLHLEREQRERFARTR